MTEDGQNLDIIFFDVSFLDFVHCRYFDDDKH
jgi:hypothetical protein